MPRPPAALAVLLLARCVTAYLGEPCIDGFTKTEGRCADGDSCQSAVDDFLSYGVRPTRCEYTKNGALVCCRDGVAAPAATTTTTATPEPTRDQSTDRFSPSSGPGSVSIRKCRQYSKSVTETISFAGFSLNPSVVSIQAQKCNYSSTELIVGGETTKQGEFPHMVAIGWRTFDDSWSFECGGALISERFVLTAGHCTYSATAADPQPAVVRLGDQNLNPRVRDKANPIEVAVKNVYKHPEYKSPKRYNDIALLELESDVKFNNDIRPACLWVEDGFGNYQKAIATGWGVVDSISKRRSDELQKVSLSLLDSKECNVTLRKLQDRRWRQGFQDTQLCAGETREGKDTCRGDSGSPLQVVAEENQCIFKVMGLTSFGAKVCGNKQPAVYTRVSSFVGWIESIVWPNEQ